MADFDEHALVERCRTGDDAAFTELVDRYKDLVFAMVYRMARDRTRADDLAQDVFLKIYRGLPYFRGEARLSTWIYRIVANVCSQERSRRAPDVSLEPARPGAPRIDRGGPDAAFGDLELRDRLDKAIAQLPDNYRMLIAAHYLDGIQYEALAETLGVPLGTIKTHLHRAKRRLRELMQ